MSPERPPRTPLPSDPAEALAQIRRELTQLNRAERDRLVRAGRRKPRTQREGRLWLEGSQERLDRQDKLRARGIAQRVDRDAELGRDSTPLDLDSLEPNPGEPS